MPHHAERPDAKPLSTSLSPGGILVDNAAALIATLVGATILTATVIADRLNVLDVRISNRLAAAGTDQLDTVFRALTELGGGPIVLPLAGICAAVAWRRSPPLGAAILLAVAARYGMEGLLKDGIGRDHPTADRVIEATGYSFPSGHVFGATVGWGLVPAAVRAVTDQSAPWRAAVGTWAVIVALVATSRVYLGVHWFTDTLGSVLFGLLVLALLDVAGRSKAPQPVAAGHTADEGD